jgi:hypothetical protein
MGLYQHKKNPQQNVIENKNVGKSNVKAKK